MEVGVIYAITFAGSDKRYVGSAKNIGPRMRAHMSLLRKGQHHSIHLQRAFNRRSETDLSVTILEDGVPNEKLIEREQVWLDRYRGRLYNISPTASSRHGATMSAAARRKISESLIGNSYRTGIPHDQETRDRIGRGVAAAYAEGRRRVVCLPENLASFNAAVAAGDRQHPSKNPERDRAIVASHQRTRSLAKTGAEFSITPSAVWCVVKRCAPGQLRKWIRKS